MLRICNTYCFSMATIVTSMHLNVTLPVLLEINFLTVLSWYMPRKTEETKKTCQDSMWSGREWKQVPIEYKSEVLLLETTYSVRSQVWNMKNAGGNDNWTNRTNKLLQILLLTDFIALHKFLSKRRNKTFMIISRSIRMQDLLKFILKCAAISHYWPGLKIL